MGHMGQYGFPWGGANIEHTRIAMTHEGGRDGERGLEIGIGTGRKDVNLKGKAGEMGRERGGRRKGEAGKD